MWIDSFTPKKITSDGYTSQTMEAGPDEYIKVIANQGSSVVGFVALDSSGTVFGNGNDFATATNWQILPGGQVIGNFTKVTLTMGSAICYVVPKDTQI